MSTTYNLTFGQLVSTLQQYASSEAAKAALTAALGTGNEAFLGTTTTDIFDGSSFTGIGGATPPFFNSDTNTVVITNASGNTFISEAPSSTQVNIVDSGFDLIVSGNQTSHVLLNVANTSAYLIDTVVGGSVADGIAVQTGRNLVLAGSGAETVWAGTGLDTIYGGVNTNANGGSGGMLFYGADSTSSRDTVNGSSNGSDTVQFFRGDNAYYAHGAGSDTVYTGAGVDTVDLGGSTGNDYVWGTQDASFGSTIYGGAGQSHIQVFTGNNDIFGGSGTDTIYTGAGADSFTGGAGADTVYLGVTSASVTQTIVGGNSTDVFTGDTATVGSTITGGYTQVTLGSGQTVDLKNVTIHFNGGTTHIS